MLFNLAACWYQIICSLYTGKIKWKQIKDISKINGLEKLLHGQLYRIAEIGKTYLVVNYNVLGIRFKKLHVLKFNSQIMS